MIVFFPAPAAQSRTGIKGEDHENNWSPPQRLRRSPPSRSATAFSPSAAADAPPPWAYGFTTPVPPGTPEAPPNPAQVLDNVTLHTLPGSEFSFTRAQIANRYGPADWFPEDHPAMPDIVARGREIGAAADLCLQPVSLSQRQGASGERQHHRADL